MLQTELWLTPLILLPGVALLIVSTSARFGQIHSEFHHLIDHPDAHAKIVARHLVERSALFRNSLLALYLSVGLLSLGSFAGGIINLWLPDVVWLTGFFTILGILCILWASAQLVIEAWTCMKVISDHDERIAEIEAAAETEAFSEGSE